MKKIHLATGITTTFNKRQNGRVQVRVETPPTTPQTSIEQLTELFETFGGIFSAN